MIKNVSICTIKVDDCICLSVLFYSNAYTGFCFFKHAAGKQKLLNNNSLIIGKDILFLFFLLSVNFTDIS